MPPIDRRIRKTGGNMVRPAAPVGSDRSPIRLAILLLTAAAARAVTFGNPIVHVDEEFYLTVGRMMAGGAIPYVDVWDRKPIGLFLLYLPAGWLEPSRGIIAYQAMALAAVVATAMILAGLADRAGWRRGGTAAAAFYILWLDLADGQGGQAPVFYGLLVAGAVALIVAGEGRDDAARRWRARAAMLLIGLALQVKYSVLFEGVALGLWLMWREWRASRSSWRTVAEGAMLACTALLPTMVAAAAYGLSGHGRAFLYANFISIGQRHPDPAGETLGNLATDVALLAPLLLAAAVGGGRRLVGPASRTAMLLRYWLVAALVGFLAFGSWFNHYTLPVMAPAACCTAAFLSRPRVGRVVAFAIGLLAFTAGQVVLRAERRTRGTPEQFRAIVAAIGPGPGSLYVYAGSTMLHVLTGRPAMTRYPFPSHLMLSREHGAVGVDQAAEVDRIFARRPGVVVVQSREEGEDAAIRARAFRRLAQGGYHRYATLPLGNKTFALFRRD